MLGQGGSNVSYEELVDGEKGHIQIEKGMGGEKYNERCYW